jgi:predicted PurR-regulated permease PerM
VDNQQTQLTVWRVVEGAAVLLVLGFFLVAMSDILNPVMLLALLWAVLLPFRGKEGHTELVSLAGLLTLIWLLSTTGSLLAPFVLAMVLAYVLDPLVDALEQRRVPRTAAIALLTLPAVGLLGVLFLLVLPSAIQQLGEIVQAAPLLFERIAGWLERLRNVDSAVVVAFLQERQEALTTWLWTGVLGVGRGFGSMLGLVSYVALTPVLTFYLLRDWDGLTATVAGLLPAGSRESFVSFASGCDNLISRYLRGQVTVAIAIGLITGLGLWVVGFPHAATLGLIVAIFSVVPYLGLILSVIPAIFIALVSGSVGISLIKVAGVYIVAQLLESTVISPRIVGESVGLHPVWVVLALALGGFFFGFVGLLIGVPAAAVTKLLIVRGLERYKASDFYRGAPAS